MDNECINLCNALNEIKGIQTIESCCGHGDESFSIWVKLCKNHFENLHIIARALCSRYGGFNNWTCSAYCNDIYTRGELSFELCSNNVKGEEAYLQANKIADNIRYLFTHKNYKIAFNIST